MAEKYLCVWEGAACRDCDPRSACFSEFQLRKCSFSISFLLLFFFSFGYQKNNACSSSHSVVSLSLMPWSNFVALYWPPFLKREAFWTLIQISLFFSHSTHLQRPRFVVFLDCGFFPPLNDTVTKRKKGREKESKKERRKKETKEGTKEEKGERRDGEI